MKTWEMILIVAILAGLSLIPAVFKLSIIHYVTGMVSVIAILIALAFFVIKTTTPIPEGEKEGDAGKEMWEKSWQSIKRSWVRICNACDNVGFILFFCILLIVGIGVFDSMISKDNEVNNKCDCVQKTEVQEMAPYPTDTVPMY